MQLIFFEPDSKAFKDVKKGLKRDFKLVHITKVGDIVKKLNAKDPITLILNFDSDVNTVEQINQEVLEKFPGVYRIIATQNLASDYYKQHQDSFSAGDAYCQKPYDAAFLTDSTLFNKTVKVWKFFVDSKRDKKPLENEAKIYNSTLDALFTHEFGFIKMHYTFENGIKIQFDLEKVVEL